MRTDNFVQVGPIIRRRQKEADQARTEEQKAQGLAIGSRGDSV